MSADRPSPPIPSARAEAGSRARLGAGRARLALHLTLAAAVGAVALGLRLHELGSESLWIDEGITHARASLEPKALVRDTLRRKHIPTYFLLMHHWLPIFGDTEYLMRLPSAVFGAGTATVGYAIGAVLAGPVAGLTTGLLLSTAVSQLYYSQEARMYAMVTMMAALGVLALALLACAGEARSRAPWSLSPRVTAERRPRIARPLLLISTVATLYLHNTAVFFVAGMQVAGLYLLALGPRRLAFARNWLLVQGLALLAWSPWVPHLLDQSNTFDRWKQRDFTWEMGRHHLSQIVALDQREGPILWILVLSAAIALVWPGKPDKPRKAAWVMLLWPLAGLGLCTAVSLYKANMMFVRTLLWVAVPAFALVGIGLARLPRGAGLLGLAALLWLNAPAVQDYYRKATKPPWRDYMQKLVAKTDKRSVIVSAGANRFVRYYRQRKTDPLPYRKITHYNRQKRLEDVVGDAEHFWLLSKTNSGRAKRFDKMLRRSRRYRRVFRLRDRSAMLARYERRK